jgi:hypothetical protein
LKEKPSLLGLPETPEEEELIKNGERRAVVEQGELIWDRINESAINRKLINQQINWLKT